MRLYKALENHFLMIAVSLMISVYFKNVYISGLICIYWLFKLKRYFIWVTIIVFIPLIPLNDAVDDYQGKISFSNNKYILIDNAIVYTPNIPADSIVKVEGDIVKLEKNLSFYTFDFNQYLINKGIFYRIDNPEVKIIKEGKSLFSLIQKEIFYFNDVDQAYLNKIILNIGSDEYLINAGFCFIGFVRIINMFLKKYLYPKKLKFFNMIFIGIFTIIYNFKVGLIRLLLFNGLTYGKFNRYDALGIGLIVYLLLFPYEIYNLGFWFVLGFYLKKMIDDKYLSYFINCLIQGIFLNRINFVLGLLYKYLVYVYGLMYITAWIILIFKIDLLFILSFIDLLLKIIDKFSINGNPLGIGLIFVLLLYKHKKIMIVTFVLMMKLALIHPLGEITFINVGQGDSILIRLPFNQGNYLIDTGKESSYKYLKNYLDAKGIKRLDYLFITHQDSDHSGNVNNLIRDYKVDNVITKKFDKIVDKICIINFNRETYDNDNDNSLIMLIDYNNLKFLFMGDASKKVERDLIDKYDFKDVDVLKAGHHGSNTSSDKLFVKEVMPLLTVFSAGKNNRYNHPHKEVLELFDNEGLAYMQTDISGDISIFILDKIKFFYTSDKRIGIIYA